MLTDIQAEAVRVYSDALYKIEGAAGDITNLAIQAEFLVRVVELHPDAWKTWKADAGSYGYLKAELAKAGTEGTAAGIIRQMANAILTRDSRYRLVMQAVCLDHYPEEYEQRFKAWLHAMQGPLA